MKPRSHCPKCGHVLGALELIPVLSYVFQGGKCRQCKAGISPLYPIIELTTGLLFLFAALMIGWTPELVRGTDVDFSLCHCLCLRLYIYDYSGQSPALFPAAFYPGTGIHPAHTMVGFLARCRNRLWLAAVNRGCQ